MIVVDRQDIVTRVRDLIDNAVGPGAENLVEEVFDYLPEFPDGRSPLVAVGALRSQPGQSTAARISDTHTIVIYLFVLYTNAARNINERDAWVALNGIWKRVVQVLLENKRVEGLWSGVRFEEESRITVLKVTDQGYLMEVIPVQFIVA